MSRILSAAAIAVLSSTVFVFGACSAAHQPDSEELVGADDSSSAGAAVSGSYNAGDTLIAIANVNLRSKPSTAGNIYHVVPNGASVTLVEGDPVNGFYHVNHNGTDGWSFGKYYKFGSSGGGSSSSSSGGGGAGGGGASSSSSSSSSSSGGNISQDRQDALDRAQSAMGFSYWWGHGRFRPEGPNGANNGSCSGSCPNCSHSGQYGGDCSGLVAKVWQVPSSNSDITVDDHPYSTASFVSDTAQWSTISRSSLEPADAMVYHSGGAGHIFVFNSGDGWGSIDAFECKGCAAGCVHDTRTASSAYHAIRHY